MIEGIAEIRVPVGDAAEVAWLDEVTGQPASSTMLGSIRLVPDAQLDRMRLDLAVADSSAALRRLGRRGLSVTDDGVQCRGIELGIREPAQEMVEGAEADDVVYGVDHVVVRTGDAESAVAAYGGRLGLDLRLDRDAPQWGSRMMFFRCGDAVLEVVAPSEDAPSPERDLLWGLALRVRDIEALTRRVGAELGQVRIGAPRQGRKPGTHVASVHGVRTPLLLVEPADK